MRRLRASRALAPRTRRSRLPVYVDPQRGDSEPGGFHAGANGRNHQNEGTSPAAKQARSFSAQRHRCRLMGHINRPCTQGPIAFI